MTLFFCQFLFLPTMTIFLSASFCPHHDRFVLSASFCPHHDRFVLSASFCPHHDRSVLLQLLFLPTMTFFIQYPYHFTVCFSLSKLFTFSYCFYIVCLSLPLSTSPFEAAPPPPPHTHTHTQHPTLKVAIQYKPFFYALVSYHVADW